MITLLYFLISIKGMADYLCRVTITCIDIFIFHQQIIVQLVEVDNTKKIPELLRCKFGGTSEDLRQLKLLSENTLKHLQR